jgi:transcriptional regulator with XRE-family HTH domain
MKRKPNPENAIIIEQIMKEIGSRVRNHRQAVSKNYEDFAKKYGLNKVTLLKIENGGNYNFKNLLEISIILKIPLEEITRGIN